MVYIGLGVELWLTNLKVWISPPTIEDFRVDRSGKRDYHFIVELTNCIQHLTKVTTNGFTGTSKAPSNDLEPLIMSHHM
jgi:hypothetical protein